jgi:hypothetical protein
MSVPADVDVGRIPVAQPSSRDNWSNLTGFGRPAGVPFYFAWGCFRYFVSGALRCTAMDIPGVCVFKAPKQQKDVGGRTWASGNDAILRRLSPAMTGSAEFINEPVRQTFQL